MADEAVARAKLAEMQERIARDPFEAFGVANVATPAEIRASFHTLAKMFHPARFGRMAPDIQRLANEVFLALRAAHDAIAKANRPSGSKSGMLPIVRSQGSTAQPPPAASPQTLAALAAGTARGPNASVQPLASIRPPGQADRPQSVTSRPPERIPAAQLRPTTPPSNISTTRPIPRQSTPNPRPRTGEVPPLQKPAAASRTPEDQVSSALELLQRGEFAPAKTILQDLADRNPAVPRYRALVSYAVGRQAQIEQRLNEARIELDRALQIDPTLQVAKTALGELFSRRK